MARASLSQAARLLKCSTAYLRRLCLDGRIKGARKASGGWMWEIPIPVTIIDLPSFGPSTESFPSLKPNPVDAPQRKPRMPKNALGRERPTAMPRWSPRKIETALKLRGEGFTWRDIGERLGSTPEAVRLCCMRVLKKKAQA